MQLIKSNYVPEIKKLYFAVPKSKVRRFRIQVQPVQSPSLQGELVERVENAVNRYRVEHSVVRQSKILYYVLPVSWWGAGNAVFDAFAQNEWELTMANGNVLAVGYADILRIYLFTQYTSNGQCSGYFKVTVRYSSEILCCPEYTFYPLIVSRNSSGQIVCGLPFPFYSFTLTLSDIKGYMMHIDTRGSYLEVGTFAKFAEAMDNLNLAMFKNRTFAVTRSRTYSSSYAVDSWFSFNMNSPMFRYRGISWPSQTTAFIIPNVIPHTEMSVGRNNTFLFTTNPSYDLNLYPHQEYTFELDTSQLPESPSYDVYLLSPQGSKDVFIKTPGLTKRKRVPLVVGPFLGRRNRALRTDVDKIKFAGTFSTRLFVRKTVPKRNVLKATLELKNIIGAQKRLRTHVALRRPKNAVLRTAFKFSVGLPRVLKSFVKLFTNRCDVIEKPVRYFSFNNSLLNKTGRAKLLLVGPVEYVVDGEDAFVQTIPTSSEWVYEVKVVLTVPRDFGMPEQVRVFLLPLWVKMTDRSFYSSDLEFVAHIELTDWLKSKERIQDYVVSMLTDFDWAPHESHLISASPGMLYEDPTVVRPSQSLVKLYVTYRSKLIGSSLLLDRPVFVESVADLERMFGAVSPGQSLLRLASEYIKMTGDPVYVWPISSGQELTKVADFLQENLFVGFVAYAGSLKNPLASQLLHIASQFQHTIMFITVADGSYEELSGKILPHSGNAVVLAQENENLLDIVRLASYLDDRGSLDFLNKWPSYEEAVSLYNQRYSLRQHESEAYVRTLDKTQHVFALELARLQRAVRAVRLFEVQNRVTDSIDGYLVRLRRLLDGFKGSLIRDYELSVENLGEVSYTVHVTMFMGKLLREIELKFSIGS